MIIFYVTPGIDGLPMVSEIYPEKELKTCYKVTPGIFTGFKARIEKDDEHLHSTKEAAYEFARTILGKQINELRQLLTKSVAHIQTLEEMESAPDVTEDMVI